MVPKLFVWLDLEDFIWVFQNDRSWIDNAYSQIQYDGFNMADTIFFLKFAIWRFPFFFICSLVVSIGIDYESGFDIANSAYTIWKI